MTTTDRRDADDAQFADELARLDRLDVADEDTVTRLGVVVADTSEQWGIRIGQQRSEDIAAAVLDALKPAPGTDTGPTYADVECFRGRHEDGGWYCVGHGQSWPCVAPGTDTSGQAVQRVQPTPHVCQFCDTPLADHWWDACTYTPPAAVAGPQRDHDEEKA